MVSNLSNIQHEWLVRLKVEGSVNIGTKVTFNDVSFIQRKKWIEASARINETNREAAENMAIRRVSDILNVLSFISDSSMKLVGVELVERSDSLFPVTIRMLNDNEVDTWKHLDELTDSDLFRGLGYYRKGLNELDPFDAFLAFWNAIENTCSRIQGNGMTQKICGFARENKISIDETEIRELNNIRNRIVHGAKRYDIDQIKHVAEKIPKIRELAKAFLTAKIS